MRFEIKSGGIVAILLAVTLLSGGVFVLGLLAGYDVGRETEMSSAQVATTYPLEPSPLAQNSPASSPSMSTNSPVANIASNTTPAPLNHQAANTPNAAPSVPGPNKTPPPRIISESVAPSAPPPRKALPPVSDERARVEAPIPAFAPEPSPGAEPSSAPSPLASASRPTTPRPMRRKPFDIQIQAAMDLNGANEMIHRLQRLGYQPHLAPTAIGGKTWYRVEIGPYATQNEAAAAEVELRQKYNAAFGGGAGAADDSDSE